jgi:hypothetical protein
MTTLGIYIPSFGRSNLALATLENLQLQLKELSSQDIDLDVRICLSVNCDASYNNDVFAKLTDLFLQREVNLGADVNIGLGFACALNQSWDYLWIIGDDEPVAPDAILTISRIIQNRRPSLIVGSKNSMAELCNATSFLELNDNYGSTLTFISSTVYKVTFTKFDVEQALEFAFSSYSHVAMLNLLIVGKKLETIVPVDMQDLCDYHYKVNQDPLKPRSEYGKRDSRVFFGKLIACLATNDDTYVRSEFIKWWKVNWHRFSMYKSNEDFRGFLVLGVSSRWKMTQLLSFFATFPFWRLKEKLRPVPKTR